MRIEIAPGASFPDYELPDSTARNEVLAYPSTR